MRKQLTYSLFSLIIFFGSSFIGASVSVANNPIAQELANLKKNNEDFKNEYKLKNSSLQSLLLDIRTMAFIDTMPDLVDQIANYTFFKIFPGPLISAAFPKGLVFVSATQAPKLHYMIENLAQAMNIAKPAIFIARDKKLFNACASSLAPNASLMIIGEKLLNTLSESELQSVLAHELAHVKNNHIPKQLCCSLGILIGTIVAWRYFCCKEDESVTDSIKAYVSQERKSSDIVIKLAIVGSFIAAQILMLKFSRTCEEEADTDAIKVTNDPQGFINMIGKIENYVDKEFSKFEQEYAYVLKEIEKIEPTSSWHAWLYQSRAQSDFALAKITRDQALKEDGGTHPSCKTRKEYAQAFLPPQLSDYSSPDSLS
ncbi:M48 family metalloprotease [Candidatus Babeliales bacterium]|nr:M48 family metalloprotease [Candidatus Babeliales bacterium]